jgi:hypothetical protein
MSPREKHIPDYAQRTSVCLTAEDKMAIFLVGQSRRLNRSRRTTTNDILVDALWDFFERTERKTKEQVRALLPAAPAEGKPRVKVAEMPKPKDKH